MEVDGSGRWTNRLHFFSKVDVNGRRSVLHRPPQGKIRTADANFLTKADEGQPKALVKSILHTILHLILYKKIGVHEYAAYYIRHVLTFKCFTGSKLYQGEVTHKL